MKKVKLCYFIGMKMLAFLLLQSVVITSNAQEERVFVAEYEEMEAILLKWSWSEKDHFVQAQMIRAIQEECEAWIMVESYTDSNEVKLIIESQGAELHNYRFFEKGYSSIWVRDFGPLFYYTDQLRKRKILDQRYFPSQQSDDVTAQFMANELQMEAEKTLLLMEGGNFLTNGRGIGITSRKTWWNHQAYYDPAYWKGERVRDTILHQFQLDTLLMLDQLKCDGGTGHVDLFMKFMSDETILVVDYEGRIIEDDEILEKNLNVLKGLRNTYGRPFTIQRITIPLSANNTQFEDCDSLYKDIRGYVNGVFVNKSYLLPIYNEEWNTDRNQEAIEFHQKLLPGYKIVPIDAKGFTPRQGALHCITMHVPIANPIRIWHPTLNDSLVTSNSIELNYQIDASQQIDSVKLWYKLENNQWEMMYQIGNVTSEFNLVFPEKMKGTVSYYFEVKDVSGKKIEKPITGKDGAYQFQVDRNVNVENFSNKNIPLFPNPSRSIIKWKTQEQIVLVEIYSVDGKRMLVDQNPQQQINIELLSKGAYLMKLVNQFGQQFTSKFFVY